MRSPLAVVNFQGSPRASAIGELLLGPVAEAVRQAEAESADVRRALAIQEQREEAARERDVADASLGELEHRRRRLELEAAPGLAGKLIALDKQVREFRARRDEAAERVRVLDRTLNDGRRALEEARGRAARKACERLARELEARRARLVAELAEVCSPLLDDLLATTRAMEEARNPAAVEHRVRALLVEAPVGAGA
jgi:hypothetical protein